MSIFIERKVALPRQISGIPVVLCWHPSLSIFANCTYNENLASGSVSFFDHTGAFLSNLVVKTRSSYPECAVWHPKKRLLVVAWRDGKIFAYDLDSGGTQEGSPSAFPITKLTWNGEGTCVLVAVDKANNVLLWKTVSNFNILKPSAVYEISQNITFFTFLQFDYNRVMDSGATAAFQPSDLENPDILIGCKEGGLFHLNQFAKLTEALQLTDSIRSISYFQLPASKLRSAYVVSEALRVIRYQISTSGEFEEKSSILLSGKTPASSLCWMDAETLAVASVEHYVRVWDLPREQNIELAVGEFSGTEASEVIRTISANKRSGTVVGATNTGNVLFWNVKRRSLDTKEKGRLMSSPLSLCRIQSEMRNLLCNEGGQEFLGASSNAIFNFQEQPLASHVAYPLIVVQISADLLSVSNVQSDYTVVQKTSFGIIGTAVAEKMLAVWGQDKVCVYDAAPADQGKVTLTEVSNFKADFVTLALYDGNVVAANINSLAILSFEGVVKWELRIQYTEGSTMLMDVRSSYCVVGTTLGNLKMADLDKIDSKNWIKSKSIKDNLPSFLRFVALKMNSEASFIAFLADQSGNAKNDASFYVWDTERDTVMHFDCSLDKEASDKNAGRQSRHALLGMTPVDLVWDAKDPRLLCVLFTNSKTASGFSNQVEQQGKLAVVKRSLPDFEGFDQENWEDFKKITDFCYFSALGKIAEALNSVKTPDTVLVWKHLTKLCLRLRKLDFAKICLSKLGRADILADLRSFAQRHSQLELQIGHLASLLQLKEVAESYFAQTPELSSGLQTAAGDWTGVLEKLSSSTADRLCRREMLFSMAQNDVVFGDTDQAIQKLTEANCEKFDVPRLMLSKRPSGMKSYIDGATDSKLFGWYGRFLETQGQVDEAVEYYRKAGDLKSIVRVMSDRKEEALGLVRISKDKAAAFQLAHTLEADEKADPEVLIELYQTASAYSNAMRICMDHGLDDQLVKLAQKSEKPEMIAAAKYLEAKGLSDKAISLYHRAGQLSKATDLAFEQGYYGNIETISEDIDESSDPVLIKRCVQYFAEHNQVDRAVNLLIRAKKLLEAVQLCVRYQMTVDGELVNLVLEQSSTATENAAERTAVLEQLADRCFAQGLFHEAARLLIEIKRPEAAMKALVKTGDIDAIVRYIRIIRDPDALIVAGNHLQAHPWHQKKEIFDAIVLAYKRAGAQLYLASFYDSWGETACESGRYDVAVEAFGKSLDVLGSVVTTRETIKDMETAKEEMDTKKKVIIYFLEVQREAEKSAEEAISPAEELLKHTKWESGLRAGHVLALLISTAVAVGALSKAKKYLRQLKEDCPSNYTISDFVDDTVLLQLQSS